MDEKISIIMPIYNAEKYLRKSIESVLGQTYENLQIICVDDGSNDMSWEILEEYAVKDSRVEIYKKKNEGVSVARNYALDKVNGEFILFVDSDDWIEVDACAIAISEIKRNSADVIMWPYIREINGESRKKYIFEEHKVWVKQEVQNELHRRMIGVCNEELRTPENADSLCTVWGKLYRRKLIEENSIRFYDIRKIGTYEEGLFNLEVFKHAQKVCYINEYLYHYRKDNDISITSRYNPKLQQQWQNLFKIMRDYIEKNELNDTYDIALSNRISLSLIALGINVLERKTSVLDKLKMINGIITQEFYVESIKKLRMVYLPLHWKIFFCCAKLKFSMGVYILLVVIQKIRGK